MTDAHCHVSCGDPTVREFLIGRDFFGVHPWSCLAGDGEAIAPDACAARLRERLTNEPHAGVGEIGLDRLKVRAVPPIMRAVFEAQLNVALELRRPVVLHGAKCWGQVVETLRRSHGSVPGALFHGFSRSDGLLPDIVALGGYVSVGPAVLNDHAVNYRELVRKIPAARLLVETDRTQECASPSIRDVLAKVAELRGKSFGEMEALTDRNADDFRGVVL